MGIVLAAGNTIANIIESGAPFSAGLLATACVWSGLGVYGAATLYHVCGRDGWYILHTANPVKLMLWLPMIPIGLILFRVRSAVRLHARLNPDPRRAAMANARANAANRQQTPLPQQPPRGEAAPGNDVRAQELDNELAAIEQADPLELRAADLVRPASVSRIVVGGLALPYISSAVGHLVLLPFGTPIHPLDRTLLGGLLHTVGGRSNRPCMIPNP